MLPRDLAILLGVALGTTVVAWLVGRGVAGVFLAPLEKLGVAATAFASGNREARADVEGPREIRIVAEALNEQANVVERALKELKAEARQLKETLAEVLIENRVLKKSVLGDGENAS